MSTSERNDKARNYVVDKLSLVSRLDDKAFEKLENLKSVETILDNLIEVKANGFRGIVATALAGKHLNPSYDPLNNFYDCNPRSIFEKGIWYAFDSKKIPSGKSDPLNVAKNISVLDEEWVRGRRPQSAARAAVDFLRIFESVEART